MKTRHFYFAENRTFLLGIDSLLTDLATLQGVTFKGGLKLYQSPVCADPDRKCFMYQ